MANDSIRMQTFLAASREHEEAMLALRRHEADASAPPDPVLQAAAHAAGRRSYVSVQLLLMEAQGQPEAANNLARAHDGPMPVVRGKGTILSGPTPGDAEYEWFAQEMEKESPGATQRGLWKVKGHTLAACIADYARASGEPLSMSPSAPWLLLARHPFPETPVRMSCMIYRDGTLITPLSFDFAMESNDEIRFNEPRIC